MPWPGRATPRGQRLRGSIIRKPRTQETGPARQETKARRGVSWGCPGLEAEAAAEPSRPAWSSESPCPTLPRAAPARPLSSSHLFPRPTAPESALFQARRPCASGPLPSVRTCSNQVQPVPSCCPSPRPALSGPSPPPAKLGTTQDAPSPRRPLEIGWSPDAQPLGLGGTFLPKGVSQLSRASSSGHKVGLLQLCPPHPSSPRRAFCHQRQRCLRAGPASGCPGSERKTWWLAGPGKQWASGPTWAVTAGAFALGVLLLSGLLCAVCCCRRRKKPKDKEAVGLGSARGTTTARLVQPDVESLQSSPAAAQPWGRLQLSLEYHFGRQEIRVGLRQAADLRPGGTVDPYARLSVSTQPGHRHETKVHRGTLCPVFDETCCFHVSQGWAAGRLGGWGGWGRWGSWGSGWLGGWAAAGAGLGQKAWLTPLPQVPQAELPGATLQVQLFHFRRFSGHEPLGELCLPLGTMDLQHVLEHWYPLGPPGATEPEHVGELCCSLRYVPGSGRLTVVVLEARGLHPGLAGEGHTCPRLVYKGGTLCSASAQVSVSPPAPLACPEPYVKVQLMLNQRKWKKRKTAAKKGTAAPYFNEAFTFLVPFSQVQNVDLVLAVWDRGPKLRAEPVGKVHLGARASGQPLQHWADMLAHARQPVVQWHPLRPVRDVDRALALQPHLRLPLTLLGTHHGPRSPQ
ncbi:Synaptotagmin-8 [Plecturocebus cupreus]